MPTKLLRKALESIKDIKEISNHFGVSEDAVLSSSIGLIKTREKILRTPKDVEPAIMEDCL